MKEKSNYFIIGLCIFLLLATVYGFWSALREGQEPAIVTEVAEGQYITLPTEAGVFRNQSKALYFANMPEGGRSLVAYYENRAFPGAPPMIPHPLLTEEGIGGKNCNQCHENGGYVAQFKAFAPITPHPDYLNCRQCHVPKLSSSLFKGTDYKKPMPPATGQAAFPGGPPVIPHGFQLRENCLSCHAGPAAPKAIRVTHPERVNCRQCHVSKSFDELFEKPQPLEESTWERPVNTSTGSTGKVMDGKEISAISSWLAKQ